LAFIFSNRTQKNKSKIYLSAFKRLKGDIALRAFLEVPKSESDEGIVKRLNDLYGVVL